jgi:hypothetical protein
MGRFIALPVGQGDAFYLTRDGIHILVDGGRARRALPGILKTHANPPRLDIVVCTHNDADHANGIIGLLEEQPAYIREVWLPGTWTWRFSDLVANPRGFFAELANDINNVGQELKTLEHYYERHFKDFHSRSETTEHDYLSEQGSDAGEWLIEVLSQAETGFWEAADLWLYRHLPWWYKWPRFEYQKVQLWLECVNAAHRIKKITEAALNAGAKIKLFEFLENPAMVNGGHKGWLEPVNSREVGPSKGVVPALLWLALTEANRESLVFYAPERLGSNAPSVLFCADSDLAFGLGHITTSPSSNLIATSPHHGSEANATAYKTVANWWSDVIWVRSDCRSKTRPGASFKRQTKRLCTLCNPPSNPKAAVRLHAIQSRWQRTRGTRWCSCR